jgi:putative zinc finger protein
MTGWSGSSVRHIPEDELHAYLDQALSRSQCVEIERHLATCPRCRDARDGIAAIRDRTTAILATLGPDLVIPPPFEVLTRRLQAQQADRQRLIRRGAWAAALLAALGLGWQTNRWIRHPAQQPAQVASAQPVRLIPTPPPPPPAIEIRTATRSAPRRQAAEPRLRRATPSDPFPAGYEPVLTARSPLVITASSAGDQTGTGFPDFEVSRLSSQTDDDDFLLLGLWRSMAPDSLGMTVPLEVPRVPGLPVVQWRVQPGEAGAEEVNAVDQLLDNGQLIRTISGPAARVAALVDAEEVLAEGAQADPAQADRMTLTVRQGDRMLAVSGPAHLLGSLISRVSAAKRY